MTIDSTQTYDVGTRTRYLIVIATMIGAVLEVLDTSITNVAIPQMQGNLGATLAEIGWVNTGYIISNVIVLPITGWLSDRFGQRNYFTASIILFTLASFFCGLSHSLSALIFWRIVQGAGGAGLLSTGQLMLLRAFPPKQQSTATAIFGMGIMIGPSLGPVLGGFLTDNLSWPWIFYVNLPFGIAAAVMTLLYVPASADIKRSLQRIDVAGFALLAAGMGALQTVLERGQEDDWFQSQSIVTLTVISAFSLIGFVWWELHCEHPIVNLRVFKNRSLAVGCIFGGVLGIGLYSVLFLLPVFLQNLQKYTAMETGLILLPSALMSMLSFMIAGAISQKVDSRKVLLLGTVLFLLGALGLSHLTSDSGASDTFWPLIFRGLSLGFLFIPLTISSLASLKPEEMGVGSAMINLTRQLGGSIGIAAASTVLTRGIETHRANMVTHLGGQNGTTTAWLTQVQSAIVQHGQSIVDARQSALVLLSRLIDNQCAVIAFNDAFTLVFIAFLVALPLILLFEKPKPPTPSRS
jgi:DHA2 family multidrug resistance protein